MSREPIQQVRELARALAESTQYRDYLGGESLTREDTCQLYAHLARALLSLAQPDETLDKLLDKLMEHIQAMRDDQLAKVYALPSLRKMESRWRELQGLVERPTRHTRIEMIDAPKEVLAQDMAARDRGGDSGFARHINAERYGDGPVTAVIGCYSFDNSKKDLRLLEDLGKTVDSYKCVFLTKVASRRGFLRAEALEKLKDTRQVSEHFERQDYRSFKALRREPWAVALGLALQGVWLRAAHEGMVRPLIDPPLFGHPAMALAGRLVDSFEKNGWCLNIRGAHGGGVVEVGDPAKTGMEDRLTLTLEPGCIEGLAEEGLIPLRDHRDGDHVIFPEVNSLAYGHQKTLAAQIPYRLMLHRFVHNMIAALRDQHAESQTRIRQTLQQMMGRLVAEEMKADTEAFTQKPLRAFEVDCREEGNMVTVSVRLTFHLQQAGENLILEDHFQRRKR